MDRKGEITVEVNEVMGMYNVTCRFKPQTRFDNAVNAKFNDAKSDSLCKKGLALFLNVATNETLNVSGLYSAAPVRTEGERLCYSFRVPVSGCSIEKIKVKPRSQVVAKKSDVDNYKRNLVTTNAASILKIQEVNRSEEKVSSNKVNVVRSSSYVCIAKYREINGKQSVILQKEYTGHNFKSQKEFDQFCRQEFARIRAKGEANLRAVRNLGH